MADNNSFLDTKKDSGDRVIGITLGQHKLDLKRRSAKPSIIPELDDISIEHQLPPPPCPYDHLVLVVHGIGRHDDGYFEMIKKMNTKFDKMFSFGGIGGGKRVKFIAIEWHSVIREDLGSLIADVTPPQNHAKSLPKSIRAAIDDSFMDYVLFNDYGFAKKIYNEVTDQLNNEYMEFIKSYPAFDGKVSIYTHSIGSIIAYDILTNQPSQGLYQSQERNKNENDSNISCWKKIRKLQIAKDKENHIDVNPIKPEFKHPHAEHFSPLIFQTYNLISAGSPVGLIISLRRYNYLPIPSVTNWFNIVNICDPVSYLIEPIIDKSFKQIETNFLPRFRNSNSKKKDGDDSSSDDESTDHIDNLFANGFNNNNNNNKKRNSTINKQQQQQIQPDSSKDERPFLNYRFDHCIKPTGVHLSEYSPLLTAHSDYWLSNRVLFFIGNSLK